MKIAHILCAIHDETYARFQHLYPNFQWKNSNYEYYIVNAIMFENIDVFIYKPSALFKTMNIVSFLSSIKHYRDIPIVCLVDQGDSQNMNFEMIRFIDYFTIEDELASILTKIEEKYVGESSVPHQIISRKKMLIVDKDKSYQELLSAIFSKYYDICCEENGQQAIKFALEIVPDIIILDISLDGVDGYTVCRFIREHARTRHIPIVILTEIIDTTYKEIALEIGVYDFFKKSESPKALVKRIDSILTPVINPFKKILIVEDSNTTAYYLKYFLERHDYQTEIAYNGLDALQKVYVFRPHLIILDLETPIMNGFQFSRMLRTDPHYQNLPVIALTGIWKNKLGKFYADEIGMTEYLTKPYNDKILLTKIEKYLIHSTTEELPTQYFSSVELLVKLNGLLDRSLLELSVQREIKSLNLHIENFGNFVNHLTILINRFFIIEKAYLLVQDDLLHHVGIIYNSTHTKNELIEELDSLTRESLCEFYEVIFTPESYFEFDYRAKDQVREDYEIEFLNVDKKIIGRLKINGRFFPDDFNVLKMFHEQLQLLVNSLLLQLRLRRLSQYDYLTSIYNRQYFEQAMNREISRAARHQYGFSIVMFDIDHFKQVNDLYGHLNGDYVLKTLAQEIRKKLREEDTFCRYGGEEFVILFNDTLADAAFQAAEKIRLHVMELIWPFSERKITISCGVSQYIPEESSKDLIRRVDCALYYAKNHGRNQSHLMMM